MLMISTVELAHLLNIPLKQAVAIIKAVNDEMKARGYLTLNTRPLKAPYQIVMERLGIG